MNMLEIIEKKRQSETLTKDEINWFVTNYENGNIPDYQMSSLLMAIVINGMDKEETANLTDAMINTGEIIDLSQIGTLTVDKHSTGGVGDKTTLVLAPLMAALGVSVVKLSGRGLGHTGGTIDKLEAIKGFKVDLNNEQFINQVKEINVSVASATANLAPADKKIYALRDVTGTVGSIPLIASSIMSKKIASGADIIMLDVKVGDGAFMKTVEDARELAKSMIEIGTTFNRKVICYLTNMNEPLGNAIGNKLEIIEAIETLKGNGPADLTELCYDFASEALILTGLDTDYNLAMSEVKHVISNNSAFLKWEQLLKAQGGQSINLQSFINVTDRIKVKAKNEGYIERIATYELGMIAKDLGAGRATLQDTIDPDVGIMMNKKVGDKVETGETLCTIYTNKPLDGAFLERALNTFEISEKEVEKPKLIIDIIKSSKSH